VVTARAEYVFTELGQTFFEDFQDFSGSGFQPGGGTGVGGETEAGVYAYSTDAGNVALGIQLDTEGFTRGFAGFNIVNNTGHEVDLVDVSYDMYMFNHTDTEFYADLEFSKAGLYVDPAGGETPGAADSLPAWQQTAIEYTLSLPTSSTNFFSSQITPLVDGDSLEIGWSLGDISGLGPSDGIAIDNVRVTLSSTAIPEPHALLVLCSIGALVSLRRRR
jgi:hypothetical protein